METPRRATLSVAIITLNEEVNLARTLASVSWADEIVVVDSGSTDATRSIAHSYGARFITEPWRGFAAQKNYALSLCASEWVLSLDADEAVSPELAASIQTVITTPRFAHCLCAAPAESLSRPMDPARWLLSGCEAAPLSARPRRVSRHAGARDGGLRRPGGDIAWGPAA